jgi:glycosyltransferase involved in cell wall biosynthesis
MKIAFFTNQYLPYLSGITLSIKILKEELENLGHTVFVLGPKYPDYIEPDRRVLPLPSLPATYPGYRLVIPYSASAFATLKKEKIDLIHAHQPFGVGLTALLLAKRMRVPFVYTMHTLFPRYVHHTPFIPQTLAKRAVSAYIAFFCQQADAVIVPSLMVKRWLMLSHISTPIEVLPTGISLELAKQKKKLKTEGLEVRNQHQIPHDAKILLYVGRLSEEKNIAFLLRAFPVIRQQEPNTYLLLVGGGPKEKDYRALASKLDRNIVFAGAKEHADVVAYYLAADLFVYASVTETQGLVLSEAKMCGLPVVAVFGGGIQDVVKNRIDGYLVPRNEATFVQHVVRLLQNEELRKTMGLKAKEDAQLRFSSVQVAKRAEALYNSLIKTDQGGY